MRFGRLLRVGAGAGLVGLGAGALALASLAAQAGCGACSTGGQEAIVYSEGTTVADVYQTTPPDGEWLHFPPGRRFRFEHGLSAAPASVEGWLAFSPRPLPEGGTDPGNAAPAAGNQLIVEEQSATHLQVRNDTCGEYFLRVVATAR